MLERFKGVSICLLEFILELYPMQTECVQETLEAVHHHDNSNGDGHEGQETERNEYKVHA